MFKFMSKILLLLWVVVGGVEATSLRAIASGLASDVAAGVKSLRKKSSRSPNKAQESIAEAAATIWYVT